MVETCHVSKVLPRGSEWVQVNGEVLTVLEYLGGATFNVKFKDSPVFTSTYKSIKGGEVRNKNLRMVRGVGYYGYGKYVAKIDGVHTNAYEVWSGILKRCYDPNFKCYPKYGGSGVTVHKDWHNFQVFAEWYYSQKALYEKEETQFDVDKDLKGGRIYSADNCILLPYKLNNFIQNRVFSKGMGYVKNRRNPNNKITTTVSLLGKQVYIGLYETQDGADAAYNIAKNYVNRKMATEYLNLGMISEDTFNRIIDTSNMYTLIDEELFFSERRTLKGRIDGLFSKPENLLQRCKYKISSEIY